MQHGRSRRQNGVLQPRPNCATRRCPYIHAQRGGVSSAGCVLTLQDEVGAAQSVYAKKKHFKIRNFAATLLGCNQHIVDRYDRTQFSVLKDADP